MSKQKNDPITLSPWSHTLSCPPPRVSRSSQLTPDLLSLSPGPGPTSGSDSGDRGPGPVTNLAPVNDVWELAKSFQPKKVKTFVMSLNPIDLIFILTVLLLIFTDCLELNYSSEGDRKSIPYQFLRVHHGFTAKLHCH